MDGKETYLADIAKNDVLATIKKTLIDGRKLHVVLRDAHYIIFVDGDELVANIPSYFSTTVYVNNNYYDKFYELWGGYNLESFEQVIISAFNQCGVYNLTGVNPTQKRKVEDLYKNPHYSIIGEIKFSDVNGILEANKKYGR